VKGCTCGVRFVFLPCWNDWSCSMHKETIWKLKLRGQRMRCNCRHVKFLFVTK
jgi:hypothetical protein